MAAPFIRLLLPYCGGILLSEQVNSIPTFTSSLSCFTLLTLTICFHFLIKKQVPASTNLFGIFLNLLLVCTGIHQAIRQDQRQQSNWFGHQIENSLLLAAESETLPALGSKSARFTMKVKTQVLKNGQLNSAKGRFLLYLPLNQAENIQPGNLYLLPSEKLKTLNPTGNPGSFDFAEYNKKKNIFHQIYLNSNKLISFSPKISNRYKIWLTKAQKAAHKAMDNNIPQPHNQLAKALLIGYREEVDKDLLTTYSQTGVVHVIAVSGMHLGLIFLILQRILIFPESRFPVSKWIKFGLVLSFIWFFSAVAGSAGSIIRAAVMFSFVLFAKIIRKPLASLQSISLTAFLLLLIDPFWIWDAGFLLSFAALLSIVLYQPRIEKLIQPKHPLMKAIWELTAVTLAAQLLTIPLCITLFHQIPVYFLPANLLAVPLSSFALIGTLILWITELIGLPMPLIGQLSSTLINWMNLGITQISKLPGAVIQNINWSQSQVILAYLIIFLFSGWMKTRNQKLFLSLLTSCLLFACIQFYQNYQYRKQQLLLVYHLPGKSITALIRGNHSQFYLNQFSPSTHPAIPASMRVLGIKEKHYSTQKLITHQQQRIGIPHFQQELPVLLKTKPQFLLLTKNIHSLAPLLENKTQPGLIILDGSIPEIRAIRWSRQLKQAGIPVHNTWEKGALIKSLSP